MIFSHEQKLWIFSLLSLIFALSAAGQTTTVVNAAGQSVVEVITPGPNGLPVTSIIQTLTTTSTTAPPAINTVPTTAPVQQGPVGQPAPTLESAPATVYTYTTTDANGDTIAVVDTFTPTFAPTVLPPPVTTGTILNLSQWLASVGTNTVGAKHNGAVQLGFNGGVLGGLVGVIGGILGGAWLVLL